MTRNEARATQNMPAVEGGDELIIPLNVLIGGQANPQDSAPGSGTGGGALPEAQATGLTPDELAKLVDAAAVLIRSGFDPAAALEAVGLDAIDHLGLLPVTVQKPVDESGAVDEEIQDALKSAGGVWKARRRPLLTKADPDADARDALADMFAAFFRRQRQAVLSAIGAGGAWWDAKRWDKELTKDLYEVAVDISAGMGREQAQALGFDPDAYNVDATLAFLEKFAGKRAGWVNQATRQQLEAVLDDDSEDAPDPSSVFDAAESQRSLAAGAAAGAALAAFSRTEAGRKLAPDTATKTWRTTSSNPRASHAAMDGETVAIDEQFSNGMDFPGDTAGGADEVAGCECTVTIDRAEQEE
jgi:hypothetical protein